MAASGQTKAKMRRFFGKLWTQTAFVAPAILLLIAGFVFAYQFVRPAPPDRVVIATGSKDGAYFAYAAAYAERFRKEGFDLVLKETAGSVENIGLLTDAAADVPVAFVQGGIGSPLEYPTLTSLGSLYFEPIWVFVRGAAPKRLTELKGKRIAVGGVGSGTRAVALPLLKDNGVNGDTAQLLEIGGAEAMAALRTGTVDAAIFVGAATSRTVRTLMAEPGLAPMSFERADAYVRRNDFLSKVVLPMGTVDLEKNLPSQDVVLLAPTATVVITSDMHPALIDLMLLTMQDTHRGGGYLETPGEFPTAKYVTYPLEPAAQRFYERGGPPFLQRYLPFWAANLLDRLKVMILPLLTLLYPLFKILPPLYNWRMRGRVNRWYKDLEALDDRLNDKAITRAEATQRLDEIEHSVEKVNVPAGFAASAYTLRMHIDYLRHKVEGKVPEKAPSAETA